MEQRVVKYLPENSPVKIEKFNCEYQAFKEATTFASRKDEGVYASINFLVIPSSEDDVKNPGGIEAVEFIFVLFDVFDHFLSSVQGLAGPGKYPSGKKKYRSRWVFDVDGAFSMYHALAFPTQVRFLDGSIWRCNRPECVDWINEIIEESGSKVSEDDIFLDGGLHEGLSD